MLATRKTNRPRSFSTSSSTAYLVIASTSTCLQASGVLSSHRVFSWGAKSKWGSPHAGKVYKGFYTRFADAQRRRDKQASIETCDRQFLKINRARSGSGFRAASSWKKPDELEQSCGRKGQAEETEGEDWYSRWERQKRRQYEEFVRRVELDPYQALFGASNRWLGWLDGQVSSRRASYPAWPLDQTEVPSSNGGKAHEEAASVKKSQSSDPTVSTPRDTSKKEFARAEPRSIVKEELAYDIDPITLRKVYKQPASSVQSVESSTHTTDKTVEIPVKPFKVSSSVKISGQVSQIPSSQADHSSNQAWQTTQTWLAQEGFGTRKPSSSPGCQTAPQEMDKSVPGPSKIESALDRHLKGKNTRVSGASSEGLEYTPKETKQDDVDLLRTSDVRASAGLKGRLIKETDADKQIRRKTLEESYEKRPHELEDRLAQEMASSHTSRDEKVAPCVNVVSDSEVPMSIPLGHPAEQTGKTTSTKAEAVLTSGQVARIRSKLVPLKTKIDTLKEDYAALRQRLLDEKRRVEAADMKRADRRARELLDQEIKTQKAAMQAIELRPTRSSEKSASSTPVPHEELHGEGDMASNVHEFAGRARWYKRKAPHAECEMDAKLQRLAKEKNFVQEIRGIYEDTYGAIDTQHRQTTRPMEGEMAASTTPDTTSSESVKDIGLVNLVTQVGEYDTKDPTRIAQTLLPMEKELSMELRSLQFAIEDCKRRASGESNRENLESIHKDLCRAAEQCSRKLITAGQSVGSAVGNSPLSESTSVNFSSAENPIASQNSSKPQETSSAPRLTTHYRILAYDSSAQKVSSAKVSSQTPFVGEKPLTPLQALNMLSNPGKFLPHLMAIHNKGYDIVSGANNILVLKKVRDSVETKEDYTNRPNPIDGTTTPEVSTGNFASPTGFVNHNPVIQPEELEQERSSSPRPTDKVRREEDVFSGQSRSNWQDSKRTTKKDKRKARRRKTFTRMLLTGTLTAAACYTTGVVLEMMQM